MTLKTSKKLILPGPPALVISALLALLLISAGSQAIMAQGVSYGAAGVEKPQDTTSATQSAKRSLRWESEPGSRNCPVSMYAQQKGMSDLMKVRRGDSQNPQQLARPGQRIRLELTGPNEGQKVISAKVTVKGTSPRSRAVDTSMNSANSSNTSGNADKVKTLEVRFTPQQENRSAANLVLGGFTSISSISLTSIRYSDGTTWTPLLNSSCRTAPDPLVLIGGREIQ